MSVSYNSNNDSNHDSNNESNNDSNNDSNSYCALTNRKTCRGCMSPFQANQLAHMDEEGCLYKASLSSDEDTIKIPSSNESDDKSDDESDDDTIEIEDNLNNIDEIPQYKCLECKIPVYIPYDHSLTCNKVLKCPYCQYYLDGRYGHPHQWGCRVISSNIEESVYYSYWRKLLDERVKLERQYFTVINEHIHKST
jgi:DNA-directed RNA polymerase subunit RPC12/RpoP